RVDAARFELSSTGGVVEPPIVPLTPSTVKNLYAKGYAHNSLQSLTLTDFYASVGTTKLSLSAHLTGLRSSPLAYVKAELKELSVDELKHHWQGRFLPHTYSWVQANILGGRVEHASIALTLRWDSRDQGIRLEAIEGRGEYLDGTCKCIASLPPLRDASGTISFTKDHFSAYVAKGRLGSITVGSGTTLITGISGKAPVVHITANVEGALKDAISIAKGAGVRLELPVPDGDEDIRGTFGATLAATFPMYKTPSLGKEMTIRADIKGAEANLSVPGGGRLSEGELELHVKTRKGEEKRTLTIKKALLQSPLGISGNVSGSVTLTGTNGTSSETTVLLDLNEASLAVPLTNWHKPPRVPANLTLRRIGTMGWEFKLLGNGLSVEGNTIASGTRFEQITFTRFLVGTTDVKGTIERDTDGAYEISIEGEALDGEHFLRSLRLGEGARDYAQSAYGSKPQRYHFPLRLTTKLGQATLGGDRQIKSVSARADYDGKRWRYITAHGTLKHGREIALEFTSDEVGSKLTLSSEDAGETLRLLDLYENINGGKLKLAANFDGKNGVKGKVVIEDYKLLKAPTLTRVLTLASLTGIVNLISGEGIEFKRLEAPFTKTGKTVEIKDAIAWGDSLGISAKHGLIQLDTGTLEFEGFVVPAYTLTRVVGLIPLLGKVITGGKLSGIIAVSYKLRGEIDNPNISVNPMSILTPGILKGFLNALEELARQHGARQ
ncbi:MAG: AsmA-like C-terminal domain-containing protein, partial [Candidatus Caldarchaeum sp.]